MNLVQEDDFLTVAEVATRLKVNPQTIRNWITRGEIRAVRVGARRVRILRTDLDSFLAATGATAPRDPSESEPAGRQETEQLAAALKTARAALAADRKTDLAIALHTLILAAELVLSNTASPEPPAAAEGRLSDVPSADD